MMNAISRRRNPLDRFDLQIADFLFPRFFLHPPPPPRPPFVDLDGIRLAK